MTEKRFQKRYIEKNNKVYDTWKEIPITDELNSDNLLNVLSHLNGLGEMIDAKIEQGRYSMIKYNNLQKVNEQLKQSLKRQQSSNEECSKYIEEVAKENEQLKQALLFFLDVANGECSSSFQKDMEHDCQKLFNCSYDEAKKKYGNYDATWWELGE